MKFLSLLISSCLVYSVVGHSWIACTDYAEKNGADWDPEKCRGFPRDAPRYAKKNGFGVDSGYDFRPKGNGPGCITPYGSNSYNDEYPKAVYYRGQQVILAHPMKNHGADPACTNKYIPDNGNAIYRGRPNTDRDLKFSEFKEILVSDLGVSAFGNSAGDRVSVYPKPGYQNAPKFCDNTDKSMGTYSFNVPSDLVPGEYTFMWRWSFNSPQDLYSTCFDVVVTARKSERDALLRSRGVTNLYVACGGVVSNEGAGNAIGCDGVQVPPPPSPTRPSSGGKPRPVATRVPATKPPRTIGGQRVPVKINRAAGSVILGAAPNQATRRYVDVNLACRATASLWNGQLYDINSEKNFYKMLQKNRDMSKQKIDFFATYDRPCSYDNSPPSARITIES